ncbi:hypothetical protein OQA88_540 [Cercophora sp. LCS_1]
MVQLTEVEDEHFQAHKEEDYDDEDFTDTGEPSPFPSSPYHPHPLHSFIDVWCNPDSEISEGSDYDPSEESLADRLYALRDIVPATTRGWVWDKVETTSSLVKSSLFFVGRSAWAISVTALLVGVPYGLAYSDEQQIIAMEQEERMRQMGGELLTAGGQPGGVVGGEQSTADVVGGALAGGAKPAL